MTRALGTAMIVVDMQYDFMDGTLAVPDAHAVVEPIAALASAVEHVVLTRDYHPADHVSFSDNPQFVDKSWPVHCVGGTEGAMIHPMLSRLFDGAPMFSKGTDPNAEAYSGFEGTSLVDGERVTLGDYLHDRNVTRVLIVGLATDYCVKATAIDSISIHDFDTTVIADAVRGVNPVTTLIAAGEMTDHGVWIASSETALRVGI